MMAEGTAAIIMDTVEFELSYSNSVTDGTKHNKRVTSVLTVMHMIASETPVTNSLSADHVK
jgi:hypothetical protein